jgi:small ligand-binding sensory domain FIST
VSSWDARTGRYASALSEHESADIAATDVARGVLGEIGAAPDLAALFVTPPHADAFGEIADVIRSVLEPRTLLGATAVAVIGPRREVEATPGVALFAARLHSAPVPVRFHTIPASEGVQIASTVGDFGDARSLVLVADPFTFPVDALLHGLGDSTPHLSVIGGLASAATRPGGNRLVLDDDVYGDGAVGVLLAEDVSTEMVVSQGCRPIGSPYVVTKAEGNVIYELAGRPALERLVTMLEQLRPDDSMLASRGLHCGLVVDERKEHFARGDFLIRAVVGADRTSGAVVVGDVAPVGSTVQFQVRDAASADEDLHELLRDRRAGGALLFSCNGRGRHLFGRPDHDATVVADLVGVHAMAGMFCAGEFGPVGGRNAVHGFTASLALFPPSEQPSRDE